MTENEADAVKEDEAAYKKGNTKLVEVPSELLTQVQQLIAKHNTRGKR